MLPSPRTKSRTDGKRVGEGDEAKRRRGETDRVQRAKQPTPWNTMARENGTVNDSGTRRLSMRLIGKWESIFLAYKE